MQRSWLLALALLACGGGSQSTPTKTAIPKDTPGPSHTCPETADHMLDMMSASAKAPPEQVKAVHDAIVSHCTDDKWSQEVMTCIAKSTAPPEVEKCDDLLTAAQKDALAKDGGGGGDAAPPPPPNKLQSPVKGAPPPGGGSRGPKKGGDPEDGGE